jgi:aminocarboxymuconate-semialdehyde decarboxylase
MSAPVIGSHTHFLPRRAAAAAEVGDYWHGVQFGRDPTTGRLTSTVGGNSEPIPRPVPLETLAARLESMARRHVDVEMVSLSPTLYWYGLPAEQARGFAVAANDDLAEMVRAHPDRYIGQGYLPLQDPVASAGHTDRSGRPISGGTQDEKVCF